MELTEYLDYLEMDHNVVPPCPSCDGTGNRNRIENADYKGPWACPDCFGSGHHPDTIDQLTSILEGGFDIGPVTAKIIVSTLLDALTGDTE